MTTNASRNNATGSEPCVTKSPSGSGVGQEGGGGEEHVEHTVPKLESTPGPFCIVTFKASRPEICYQETSLQITSGDLVIVEADRGIDLGAVVFGDISLAQAKSFEKELIEEHRRWLMMFSGHHTGSNALAGSPSDPTGVDSPGQPILHYSQSADRELKRIKRIAEAHEVQNLREKEEIEVKAKRICQRKVQELHLNMEILDAEFQM